MPQSYDGDIKLKLDLDVGDVKNASKELRKQIEGIFDSSAGKDMGKQFDGIKNRMSKVYTQAAQLATEMDKLGTQQIPTAEYVFLQKEIDKAEKKLFGLLDKQERYEEAGKKAPKTLDIDITNADNKLTKLEQQMETLQQQGEAFVLGSDTDKFTQMITKAEDLNNQMRMLINSANDYNGKISKLPSLLSRIADTIRGCTDSMTKLGVESVKTNAKLPNFKKLLKTVLKYGLGIRSLYILFRKLRGWAKEAFTVLAKESAEVRDQLSSMKNSFTQFKNSIATAFQPLLSIITPIINRIMSLFVQATTAIGNFFAAMTGQKYVYKAVKANNAYAESTSNVAKATKEANEQLGEYDELMVIQQNNAGSGGGAVGNATGEGVFEKVPVDTQIADFVDSLKKAWQDNNFDWFYDTFYNLGKGVGEYIAEGLSKINWDGIKEKAKLIAGGIAGAINGFFSTDALNQLGIAVAEGINTALTFANTLLKFTDFEQIGKRVTSAIQDSFKSIDWKLVGETLSSILVSGLDLASGLVKGIDWKALPQQIANAVIGVLQGFNWKSALSSIGNLAGTLLKACFDIGQGLNEVFFNIGDRIVSFFSDHIRNAGFDKNKSLMENGKAIFFGILNGIIEAVAEIGMWIHDNILMPFVNGIKKAFGIASSSKVMIEYGKMIMQGLIEGIKSLVSDAVEKFTSLKDKITAKVDKIVTDVKTKFNTLKTNIATIFTDINTKAKTAWDTIKNTISNKMTNIKTSVVNTWNGIKTSIKNTIDTIVTNAKTKFNTLKTNMSTIFTSIKTSMSSIWNKMYSVIKSPINSMISGIQKFINGVITAFNKLIDFLNKFNFSVPSWVPEIGGKKMGIHISKLSTVSIPRLAQGAVIPPNKEFLALLGDQRNGTNIEAPLNTIVEAFDKALDKRQGNNSNSGDIVLQLNGREVARAVWDEQQKMYKQTGAWDRRK